MRDLAYRVRNWFNVNRYIIVALTTLFVVFVASLYGSFFIFGWNGNAPPLFAGFMSMVLLFGFILHKSMSEQKSRRHHRRHYPFLKPPGAHFKNRGDLDRDPEEMNARFEAMKKPDDASDMPEGT